VAYPPQPPGQGGWGQPQQGPYGPPPGGQFPPSGPQPYGVPPPQPGPYPQQGGPVPQPGYGPPPGPPGPGLPGPQAWGGPPRKKSPLPWILGSVGGVVVVIVVVVILVVTLGGGSSPQAVAQKAVDSINNQDYNGLVNVLCASEKAEAQKFQSGLNPLQGAQVPPDLKKVKARFTLGQVQQTSDTKATATMSVSYENVPAQYQRILKDSTIQAALVKESGDWKLCQIEPPH
jgi:hypothetical protein